MVQQSPGDGTAPRAERRRLGAGAIASLIGAALLIIFMVQNSASVSLHFLVWHFQLRVWVLILISALLGAVVWFGLGVMRRHRRRVERREARRY